MREIDRHLNHPNLRNLSLSPADSTLTIRDQLLKFTLCNRSHRIIVDLRYQYLAADGSIKPGKRGVSISADALPEVITALEAIKAQLVHDGYLEFTEETSPCKVHPEVYASGDW
jgi:hypothetical protein